MVLDAHAFLLKMKQRFLFTDEDKATLKSNLDWAQEIASEMADHFYDSLGRDEEMNYILNKDDGRLARLHNTFSKWFSEMFTGKDNWGDEYANYLWHIGLIHVRVGVGPQHVVPAMATVMETTSKRAREDGKTQELLDALTRICMINLAFIEQAYIEVCTAAVMEETGWSEKLFHRLIRTGADSI